MTAIISLFIMTAVVNVNATSQVIVHTGDTISSVAHKYHVSAVSLAEANRLSTGATLRNGQTMTLPDSRTDQSQGSADNQDTQDLFQSTTHHLSKSEQDAKNWIAYHESRGKYHVNDGKYYGKFQLDPSLLHGDRSKANQERTADRYVHHRYGSWKRAKQFWQAHNWY